jgi:hypothetical protein
VSITADPLNRLGDHVVLTITLPTQWVVLTHHGRDVKIDMDRLIEFDARFGQDPEEFRFRKCTWSWPEEAALRDAGWITMLGFTTLWPTPALHDALEDWRRRRAV